MPPAQQRGGWRQDAQRLRVRCGLLWEPGGPPGGVRQAAAGSDVRAVRRLLQLRTGLDASLQQQRGHAVHSGLQSGGVCAGGSADVCQAGLPALPSQHLLLQQADGGDPLAEGAVHAVPAEFGNGGPSRPDLRAGLPVQVSPLLSTRRPWCECVFCAGAGSPTAAAGRAACAPPAATWTPWATRAGRALKVSPQTATVESVSAPSSSRAAR
jgi:hypothetical protein